MGKANTNRKKELISNWELENDSKEMAPQIYRSEKTSPLGSPLDWINGGENVHLSSGKKEQDLRDWGEREGDRQIRRIKTALRKDCTKVWQKNVYSRNFFSSLIVVTRAEQALED